MAQAVSKNVLEALRRHGIRYEIYRGELFIKDEDLLRVLRLCREGRLPREICG